MSRSLPFPASGRPPLSWSVYLSRTPSKWLGRVDAASADEAIKIAAEKFKKDPARLIAIGMA
jgi:hypothetical protein